MANEPTPRADFDSPWKQVLETLFPEFVAFFFPDIHADIDWDRGWEFLDTQLQQVVREAEVGTRFADKLVKVWRRSGDETWVYSHIEIQSQSDDNFEERLFTYYYRLRDRFNAPIASLAVLADTSPTWRPHSFSAELWGCSVAFRFPSVKLLDYRQEQQALEASSNPFSVIVMAHLKTLETMGNFPSRQQSKIAMVRELSGRGYDEETILQLLRFIDWILVLPKARQQQFLEDVKQLEEGGMAPYIMQFERDALDKGKQEAAAELAIGLVQEKFGSSIHSAMDAVIQSFSYENLAQLHRAVLHIESPVELLLWLLQQPATEHSQPIQILLVAAFGDEAVRIDIQRFEQLSELQLRTFAEQFLASATADDLGQWLSEQP